MCLMGPEGVLWSTVVLVTLGDLSRCWTVGGIGFAVAAQAADTDRG
jgi:hypothetical protein